MSADFVIQLTFKSTIGIYHRDKTKSKVIFNLTLVFEVRIFLRKEGLAFVSDPPTLLFPDRAS
jgi:hypothetical protein